MQKLLLFFACLALAQSTFLTYSLTNAQDPREIVQMFFNGAWETVDLIPPSNLASSCFDVKTAQALVDTVNVTLQYLVQNNFLKAIQVCNDFYKGVSPEIKECVNTNASTVAFYKALGIWNMTIIQIDSKISSYVVTHLASVKELVAKTNSDFQAEKYVQVGRDGGIFMRTVFRDSKEEPMVAPFFKKFLKEKLKGNSARSFL